MEIKLRLWYFENVKHNNISISSKDMKQKASEFSSVPNFKASKGWLEKYLRKNTDIKLIRAKKDNKVKMPC